MFTADGYGHCVTGDCNNKLQCNGTGPALPVTQVQFNLYSTGGNDKYAVSLLNGFNVPIKVRKCLE
jgi:hypothetical protein